MSTLDTQVAQSETLEQIADRIARDWFPEHGRSTNRMALSNDILSALRNEREACAKVADERAAFNRRLMKTHTIGDPMADLKSTRADEAEVIAKEIRSADA